jgi:transcriptional regulator with XRE-family HTH domain
MSKDEQLHLIVAQNIRHRRQFFGMSQEALAEHCGLHRTYIGAIERGERNITINTLARVAEALDCSVIDLILSQDINGNSKS